MFQIKYEKLSAHSTIQINKLKKKSVWTIEPNKTNKNKNDHRHQIEI